MKALKLFLLRVLLELGWQVIRYALIFVSAFFRQRTSLGCEMVAIRSQLTFYEESIRQKRLPRPRFHPTFRLLWVLLSSVWAGWRSAAELMKPQNVLQWHEHAFLQWWRWKSGRKGGRPTINQEMRALIRRLSREMSMDLLAPNLTCGRCEPLVSIPVVGGRVGPWRYSGFDDADVSMVPPKSRVEAWRRVP